MSAQSANFVHFVTCESRCPINDNLIYLRILLFSKLAFNLSKKESIQSFCAIFLKVTKKPIYLPYNKLQYSQMQDVLAE